jgi:hypothetical protein
VLRRIVAGVRRGCDLPRERWNPEDEVSTSTTVEAEALSRRRVRITGVLYLINLVVAGIATVHVLPRLVVPGDAVATAANISASEWMLHLAVAGDLVAMALDVALSVLLYVLLRPVDRTLALLMASFRLAHTIVLIANVDNLLEPLRLLADDAHLGAFAAGQLPALTMLSLDAYAHGWVISLLFFGVHILLLGYLLYRSGYVPKVLGAWLAVVGSLGLFVYSLGELAVPGVETSLLLAAPSGVGELALCLLLLFNRVNVRPSDRQAR